MPLSRTDTIIALASEILEDAEMSRTSVESLVLKASRLARLADDEETASWLSWERFGYPPDDDSSTKYLDLTDRWSKKEERKFYSGPLVDVETLVKGIDHRIQAARDFKPSGDYGIPQFGVQQKQLTELNASASKFRRIISAVRTHIQDFATRVYYEQLFSHQAGTIFEQYQREVDAALSTTAKTAFTRLPQAFERLSAGDPEATSHALTTCRRVIESFANSVFPPQSESALIGQQAVQVGEQQVLNRLRVYAYRCVGQGSRYERLHKVLATLWGRVSAGVHSDVDASEARALVLQTYLLLGEILSLPKPIVET